MFEFISNTLTNIANFFVSVWEFITNLFKEIGMMVSFLGQIVTTVPNYFRWLPTSVLAVLILTFSIIIIYKVIGREG